MTDSRLMSLDDWIEYAQTVHFRSIDMSLGRVGEVLNRLNPDLSNITIIIVGGTNGKGSSVAMLESIYQHAGYSTAAFTSPHLICFNERYRYNSENLHDEPLLHSFVKIEKLRGDIPLTYFEFATLIAIDSLAVCQPDVLIMETGMGGRLDSVNILNPDCVLLTHIALDHTQWLGESREEIGFEKAGLLRTGVPAICGDTSPPQSIIDQAKNVNAQLCLINRDYEFSQNNNGWRWHCVKNDYEEYKNLPLPSISGRGQIKNAAGVLMAMHCLKEKLPFNEQAICDGLKSAKIQGRLQQIEFQSTPVILDVSHNSDAVGVLSHYLKSNPVKGKTLAVLGMLEDKDIQQVIRLICCNIDQWEFATINEPRGANAEQLSQVLLQVTTAVEYNCYSCVVEAFTQAIEKATSEDRVVVFGSFHTVGDVLAHVQSTTQ